MSYDVIKEMPIKFRHFSLVKQESINDEYYRHNAFKIHSCLKCHKSCKTYIYWRTQTFDAMMVAFTKNKSKMRAHAVVTIAP